MTSVTAQRDLVVTLKKETYLNIQLLSKVQPLPETLSRQIFKENALEKPTQNVFNNLLHYLVSILDPEVAGKLPWPLYDSATERAYRNGLSKFISEYSSKGLVSPVMSSYLVNPGCFKVTMLIFQLSQLAVQRVVLATVDEGRKKMCVKMSERYNSQDKEGFVDTIEEEVHKTLLKFTNYQHKKQCMEKIINVMESKIKETEVKMSTVKPQKVIDGLVDGFLSEHQCDEEIREEILKIKNVSQSSAIFENWLLYFDDELDKMENIWEERTKSFLATCSLLQENTEALISRHTGEANKSSYTLEFNPKTDEICTKDLQNKVNSEQKYILKNIIKDNKLNFPNLIQGFVISMCYILKNMENGEEIYKFNECFEEGQRSFAEIVITMKSLLDKVIDAESKLNPTPLAFKSSVSMKELSEIPPLPDLSGLKMQKELQNQVLFDTFTPFSSSKHQFNLHRRKNVAQPKSLMTPFHQGPRDDFTKNLISFRTSFYDHSTLSQNINNISVISHARGNETIAECSSGFTKQQIMRLLSTKKSSAKKLKFKTEKLDVSFKKGLFDASSTSNESSGLFRSYSSPNLYENREKKSLSRRKLSIMPEVSPSLLEVSGITVLESDNNFISPQVVVNLESTRKLTDTNSLPLITLTPDHGDKRDDISNEPQIDFEKSIQIHHGHQIQINENNIEKNVTPKSNASLVKKTSSLEKIINRFKKVRANVLPLDRTDEDFNEFKTIVEEKENYNPINVDVFTANKVLLPDLLSPSCSMINRKSHDYLDIDIDEKSRKKPRESLGTALGVDETFLDQFDLID